MTDKSPEEIHLKHFRASDYKEITADGALHKIANGHLVITFYLDDSRVTGEVLKRDGRVTVEEERQRLDMLSVRVPTKAILGIAAAVAERLTGMPEKGPKLVKK